MAVNGGGPADRVPGTSSPRPSLYNRSLNALWNFIESRTHISKWPYRPQPEFSFNPSYWTGAFVAIAFILQVLTGLLLLFYYDPSVTAATTGAPPQAWASTQYIIQTTPFGWLLLSSHLYGAYAAILLAFVHFFRGFYTGVYKRPREVSWMLGTLLLVCMLGMGFTGYLLPYTALSVGATDVGLALVNSVPVLGPIMVPLFEGNGTYQGLLSRVFALHVVLIPVVLLALLYAHVTLFESHGIGPRASSDPRAKRVLTAADDRRLGGWFPRVFLYMLKWGLVYVGFLLVISSTFLVALPAAFGSQNQGGASPEPDWYFLWLYKVADFQYVTPTIAVLFVGLLDRDGRGSRRSPIEELSDASPRPTVRSVHGHLPSIVLRAVDRLGRGDAGSHDPGADVRVLPGQPGSSARPRHSVLLSGVSADVPGTPDGGERCAPSPGPQARCARDRRVSARLPALPAFAGVLGWIHRDGRDDLGRFTGTPRVHYRPAVLRGRGERTGVRRGDGGHGVGPCRNGPLGRASAVPTPVGTSGVRRSHRGPAVRGITP
jgi:quinol-cytochrome oxidoreductase complex cytochrome b subunit